MPKGYLKRLFLRLCLFPTVFVMCMVMFIPCLILFGENIIGNMIEFYEETNEMYL